jgi:hypothetical protein
MQSIKDLCVFFVCYFSITNLLKNKLGATKLTIIKYGFSREW